MTTPSTSTKDGTSLIAILDELSEMLSQARAMPMSASVLVNRAEALDLLDAARSVVPDEISAADDVLHGADAVLSQAREQAADIVARARAEAERLVASDAVVAAAEQRAAQLVAEAEARAAELARKGDEYCDRQLAQFEIDLGAIATQVRAGRDRLASRGVGPRAQDRTQDRTQDRA
ncbi:hypothetical protein [Georgenia faecalis]|uniref:ATPase n=1 Tax=Georgenia faecalis TaxID=2483799 RepID=A0ABV9DC29_9MICO|nr:hypothetical protein [Georgenia faecalis]